MDKKNLGRRKVEMKKMANENHLQVTFCKRRTGLFKKAGELSTLCGAQVAVVVVSPSKKLYSFGHPSADTVIDRYLGRDTPDISLLVEAHRNANITQLCMYLEQVTTQLEAEKERGEDLDEMKEADRRQNWCHSPIEELDLSQLLQVKSAMEKLKKRVEEEEKLAIPRQLCIGNSSGQGLIPANYLTNNNNMMIPTPGYNPIPFPEQGYTPIPFSEQGYNPILFPEQGYTPIPFSEQGYTPITVNPAQGYTPIPVNPADEYTVNPIPVEGSNINPAAAAQGQGMDLLGPRGYDEDDFLDLVGFRSQDFGGGFP